MLISHNKKSHYLKLLISYCLKMQDFDTFDKRLANIIEGILKVRSSFFQTMSSADPEGGTGGPDPPGKSQVIWVSIENKLLDPPPPWKKLDPPPLENVGPPLEP